MTPNVPQGSPMLNTLAGPRRAVLAMDRGNATCLEWRCLYIIIMLCSGLTGSCDSVYNHAYACDTNICNNSLKCQSVHICSYLHEWSPLIQSVQIIVLFRFGFPSFFDFHEIPRIIDTVECCAFVSELFHTRLLCGPLCCEWQGREGVEECEEEWWVSKQRYDVREKEELYSTLWK